MGRVVQWFCGLAAVGTLGYLVLIVSLIHPDVLVSVFKRGRLLPLFAVPAVFCAAWLGVWQWRGRPGRPRTGAVVIGVAAVVVAGASASFHTARGEVETHEVQPTPGPSAPPARERGSRAP